MANIEQVKSAQAEKSSAKAYQYPVASFAGDYGDIGITPGHSHGTFTATGPTTGTDAVAATFTLSITQTVPGPGGTETLLDTVKGNIKIAGSGVTVTFTSGSGDGGVAVSDPDPLSGAAALRFTMPPRPMSAVTSREPSCVPMVSRNFSPDGKAVIGFRGLDRGFSVGVGPLQQ